MHLTTNECADLSQLSNEELLARHRTLSHAENNDPCVNELFRRLHSRAVAWCLAATRDPDRALDLAQDVLVMALSNLHSFRGESRVSTWLYSITRNHLRHEWSTCTRWSTGKVDLDSLAVADEGAPVDVVVDKVLTRDRFRQLMRECLNEVEREVIVLHYLGEKPLESVTSALRLKNTSGAKAYVVSARRKLLAAARRTPRISRAANGRL